MQNRKTVVTIAARVHAEDYKPLVVERAAPPNGRNVNKLRSQLGKSLNPRDKINLEKQGQSACPCTGEPNRCASCSGGIHFDGDRLDVVSLLSI